MDSKGVKSKAMVEVTDRVKGKMPLVEKLILEHRWASG